MLGFDGASTFGRMDRIAPVVPSPVRRVCCTTRASAGDDILSRVDAQVVVGRIRVAVVGTGHSASDGLARVPVRGGERD